MAVEIGAAAWRAAARQIGVRSDQETSARADAPHDGYVATAADVEAELDRIGHRLSPLEIVVVNTSAGARFGQPDYVASGCGMGYAAAGAGTRRSSTPPGNLPRPAMPR